MKKIFLLSLGCPRNLVDSEVLKGTLCEKGFLCVDEAAEADIAIVNTCGFIEDAKIESIDCLLRLAELKRNSDLEHLVVCGCLAQRYPAELLREVKEIDAVFGADDFVSICEYLKQLKSKSGGRENSVANGPPTFLYDHTFSRKLLTPPHYAYVKVQEGCSQKCSYCVIPSIKGTSRSRSIDSVVEEVALLQKSGRIKEIILVGQDTTSFGIDNLGKMALPDLLREVTGIFPEIWFRLLYTHPENFTDELIGVYSEQRNLLNYVDIPIQHINSRILKLMRRPVTGEKIRSLAADLRKKIPGVVLRTSVICGFPTETEEEFKELLDFLKEAQFERLGAFQYSQENGTDAGEMDGQVTDKVKKERFSRIMALQQSISLKRNEELIGDELEVLIDEEDPSGDFSGRSYMDAPEVDGVIYVKKSPGLKIGEKVKVKITDALEYDLVGEKVQ